MSTAPAVLKRYAPFLGIVAVQLLLVAIVPSLGPKDDGAPAALSIDGSTPGALAPLPGTTAGPGGLPVPGATSGPLGTSVGGAPGTGGAIGGGGGTTTGAVAPVQPAGSSVAKCAKGAVLQQSVTSQSIPCKASFTGDNGGATYPGVTTSTITIVIYQAKVNPVVNSVISAAGAGEDPAAQRDAIAAFSTFFQKHYELSGRKIAWKTFTGSCTVDPPDDACLRSEARTIVSTLKPFWVLWPTGRPSFFQELSKLHTLNSGGLSFSGAFNRAQRPYHWTAFMDGDRVANNVADYWCKKMNGKTASLAGDAALRTQKRVLGILVRQEPANKQAADLLASLVSGGRCSGPKPTIITYSQDIAQAQAQSSAGVAALRKAGVTTVVSLGSVLEISLQASGFDSNGYHPENLMSGTGLEDLDAAARIISSDQWNNAFGPGDLINAHPRAEDDDARAWKDAGRSGTPYTQAAITFQEMQQVVWQLQLTGTHLTPPEVERASLTMPVLGGWDQGRSPFKQRYQFSNQGYSGPSDSRQVYWDSNAVSAADGKSGAYVPVEGGKRYPVGTWSVGEPKR